jgi:hypothetical protein
MLEALLARVRQRASQPRERASSAARQASSAAAITEAPPARAMLAGDEDIEEYDDELIEVIDDGDVESEVESDDRPALPLELSASAPSVELRRPAPPAGARQNEPGRPVTARAASAPAGRGSGPAMMSSRPPAAVRSAPEPATGLQAEGVGRRPVPATSVVQAHGARPALGEQRFIDLLDASLELGN